MQPQAVVQFLALLALTVATLGGVSAFAAEKRPLPTAHTTRNIEDWTVRVDDRLLKGERAAVGERALRLLAARLVAITVVVPKKSLAKLRTITIQLDLDYGDLRVKQAEPEIFALLANIWGPLPVPAPSKPEAKQ